MSSFDFDWIRTWDLNRIGMVLLCLHKMPWNDLWCLSMHVSKKPQLMNNPTNSKGSVSSPANLTAAELHLIFADVLLHRFYWANHDPELTRRCMTLLTLFIFFQPFGPGARLRSLRGRELSHSMLALCPVLFSLHFSSSLHLSLFAIFFHNILISNFFFRGIIHSVVLFCPPSVQVKALFFSFLSYSLTLVW